jgi:hypothetical protein
LEKLNEIKKQSERKGKSVVQKYSYGLKHILFEKSILMLVVVKDR